MVWYNRGKLISFNTALVGEPPLGYLLDRIVVGLMAPGYTIDAVNHGQYSDISADGLVTGSYNEPGNAGSEELLSKTITDQNNRAELDAADLVFTGIGDTNPNSFNQIVWCREQDATASEANTELVAHATVGSTTTNGGNITLVWNANGILHFT